MQYRTIPGVGRPVSRLLFGTASDRFAAGGDNNDLLDAALAAGINTIDTARVYGLAEQSIGRWLAARGCRDQVILLSKGGHPDPQGHKRITEADIRADLDTSCALLGTDFIDIYLLHRDDTDLDVGFAVELLNALHREGRIGAFGVSNWTADRIRAANAYAAAHGLVPFAVSSPHFGLARQQADPWGGGCVSLTGDAQATDRAWYAETGLPVVAYSSLAHGLLSGKLKSCDAARAAEVIDAPGLRGYGCADNFERLARCEKMAARKRCTVAQIAMAWLYCQPQNVFAVAAMSSPARIRENAAAVDLALTPAECRYLNLETDAL